MSFLGLPNGLLARLGSTSHPSSHLIIFRQPPVVRCPTAHAAQHPTLPPACPSRVHHHPLPHPVGGWAGGCCARPCPRARPPASARPAARPSAGPLAAWRRQQRQPRPARAACAPAAWPPRRARPRTMDIRRWPLFGHPPHAEVKEAPVPGRPVKVGHFRPFPNGLQAVGRVSELQLFVTFGPTII
jgi:hypothetical protein